ncbi:MAG: efflux RND transporter permease subunit [Clostridia bacterium]|nr:efflux RND transporter permease subunit [Clostridia bacterium]
MEKNQNQLDQNIQENWFAKVGVHKPYTVFVCIMAIIVLGVFAFSKMSVDLFPSMNLPYAVVVLSPNETYLMEQANKEGVRRAKEAAAETYATNYPTNPDKINNDAADLLAILNGKPEEIMASLGAIVAHNEVAAQYVVLSQTAGFQQLLMTAVMPKQVQMENLTDDTLVALSGINGVKNTDCSTMLSFGLVMVTLEYNSDATVDLTALALAFENMALDDTINYGTKFNKTILKIDPSLMPVMYVTVAYNGAADDDQNRAWLENKVLNKISTTVGVGTVTSNLDNTLNNDQAWQGTNNGLQNTYSISIQKSSNAVTAEVCANVIRTLDRLKAENPEFSYDITSSQGEYINQSIGSVGENLIVGGILALVILFLFLRSFKMTLAIGISIPLALVGTFVAMYFMGINLNIVSMSGLALAVGMLVDNSVVVLENIYRLRHKGMPLKDACIKGSSQIMMAMLASSLTTICVFFPMFFLEGLMMEMFTDLVWVIILSLLCSFVVAVMFLPCIVSTFKINPKPAKEIVIANEKKATLGQKIVLVWRKFTGRLHQIFDKTIRFCINKKWLTVALAFVLFIGSACLLLVNGFILMPSTDEGTLSVSVALTPAGNTAANLDASSLGQPLYEEIVKALDKDIEKCVISYNSGADILSGGIASINAEIKLKDDRSLTTNQASEKLYHALQNYDNSNFADIEVSTSSLAGAFMSNEVSVAFTVDASATATQTAYQVGSAILDNFSSALANKFNSDKESLGIRSVVYSQNTGVKIQKYNNRYAATVSIKADPSADVNKIQSTLNQYVDELIATDEFKTVSVLDNGFEEQMNETYSAMGMALLVGFLLIYLVMVAIFQSFLMPFIILICVPLGFTGAFILLAMCGMPLSIPALIGCLILMGVIINNGILAVDYTNQARRDGLSVKEALVSAIHTRLRPIFMTALTTILAMVPMAFGWSLFNQGGSTAIMQPLAVVSIGGLLFGTITTLFVVPAFYAIFCRDKKDKNKTVLASDTTVQTVK